MIISGSGLTLRATHHQTVRRTSSESLRTWVDPQLRAVPPRSPLPSSSVGGPVHPRSENARSSPQSESDLHRSTATGRFATLIALIERLTGERIQLLDADELRRPAAGAGSARTAASGSASTATSGAASSSAPARLGWGMEYVTTQTTEEHESTAVDIAGTVTTADGRTLSVRVDLALYRDLAVSVQQRVTAGDVAVQDPLMLTFGALPGLSATRAAVDLDGDGTAEGLPLAAAGSAYLMLDDDGDGLLSGGHELFGPRTGDGFAELAAHDADGNGWIDEADPVFSRLRLWSGPDPAPVGLGEAGVGAIALARVASPFTFQAQGQDLGLLRSTGLWLGDDGSVGSVHQVDVIT